MFCFNKTKYRNIRSISKSLKPRPIIRRSRAHSRALGLSPAFAPIDSKKLSGNARYCSNARRRSSALPSAYVTAMPSCITRLYPATPARGMAAMRAATSSAAPTRFGAKSPGRSFGTAPGDLDVPPPALKPFPAFPRDEGLPRQDRHPRHRRFRSRLAQGGVPGAARDHPHREGHLRQHRREAQGALRGLHKGVHRLHYGLIRPWVV